MNPDDYLRLVAAGLNAEQIALVMQMMTRDAKEAAEKEEERRAKGRERWHRWSDKRKPNVSQREQTLANDSCEGVTRVEDNLLPKKISGQEEKQDISPEAAKAAPVAFELPCVSGEPFPVYDADIAEWANAFPAVDIRQQLAAMRSWLIANPTKRKTRRGMRKFIVSWLDRRQNAGGQPPARAGPAPQPRQAFNDILDSLQGKPPHDAHPGPTIDGGINRADSGGAANLVQLYAVPTRR